MKKGNRYKAGFTLIELIIVLAVMAIIASIAIPSFMAIKDNAKRKAAIEECTEVVGAVSIFMIDNESMGAPSYDDIKRELQLKGTIQDMAYQNFQIKFLKYSTADGQFSVIYDTDYVKNGREALYTIDDGSSEDKWQIVPSGDTPKEKADSTLNQIFSHFFNDIDVIDNDGQNIRFMELQNGGKTFYLLHCTGSESEAKKYIEDRYNISQDELIICKVTNISSEQDKEKLDTFIKGYVDGYGEIQNIYFNYDESGKFTSCIANYK